LEVHDAVARGQNLQRTQDVLVVTVKDLMGKEWKIRVDANDKFRVLLEKLAEVTGVEVGQIRMIHHGLACPNIETLCDERTIGCPSTSYPGRPMSREKPVFHMVLRQAKRE
jgi:hypothetical protein